MPVPQIDFDDFAVQEIPEFHRTPKFIAWFLGMFRGGISWVHKNFYNYFHGDDISLFWVGGHTYALDERCVTYFGVFISLQDNNTGNNPDITTGFWYKVSPSHIGAFERSGFSSQKIIMEWALNRYFRTVFRQPTTIVVGGYMPRCDIYIDTEAIVYPSFVSFNTEVDSSVSYDINSGSNAVFTTEITGLDTTYKFIVYVPTALSIALGASYDKIIRNKVDTISLLGTEYRIVLY